MESLDVFLAPFTQWRPETETIRDAIYLKAPRPEVPLKPAYTSVKLGKMKRKGFQPAIPLLDLLASHTERKAIVNEKSAWLFLCGHNILKEGIIENPFTQGPVLVLNERAEVLGYGDVQGAGITNRLDRGDFLRRGK